MNWSKTLLTVNLVLLAALVVLLGMNMWGEDQTPTAQSVDADTTQKLLADVEQRVETSINQALAKSGSGAGSDIATDQLASAIVERIDAAVADHEVRLKQVAEEVRVAGVHSPAPTTATVGGVISGEPSLSAEIAAVEFPVPDSGSAEPPAERKLELVHFLFDSAALTPGGQRRAAQAAQAILDGNPSKIRIAGFSDTKGNAEYNMTLSEQRAQAVADSLIAAGVDADRIEVLAFGESVLPEDTDDNVDEPLNRCVSITAIR